VSICNSACEVVSLKSFVRSGKKGAYLSCGVCVLEESKGTYNFDIPALTTKLSEE
jgi:hypothetical protein